MVFKSCSGFGVYKVQDLASLDVIEFHQTRLCNKRGRPDEFAATSGTLELVAF